MLYQLKQTLPNLNKYVKIGNLYLTLSNCVFIIHSREKCVDKCCFNQGHTSTLK